MSEIPEAVRRAMEARGVDIAAVEEALQGDPIPPDEVAVLEELPVPDEPAEEATTGIAEPVDEQAALWGDEPVPIRYENLLPPHDVAVYKRVKASTMRIAEEARGICAHIVGGTIGDGDRSDKQFIETPNGKYRLATSDRSDNSTELAAHARMGVFTIHLSDPADMIAWFENHGLPGRLNYDLLVRELRARFRS